VVVRPILVVLTRRETAAREHRQLP